MMDTHGRPGTGMGGMSAQHGGFMHETGSGTARRGPGMAAALLAFGVLVLMTAASVKLMKERRTPLIENVRETHSATIETLAIMGPSTVVGRSEEFRGAEAIAIMGHTLLDLRRGVRGDKPLTIEAVAIMGRVEIIVPPDWEIVSDDMITAAGARSVARHASVDNPRKVRLDGVVIMGRLDIHR